MKEAEAALLFAVEPRYAGVALPEFNMATADKLFCRFHRGFVVGAIKIDGLLKVAIATDK
jgi:hypothetical protein